MIYELSKELDAELATKGVPLPVVYGPEPKTTSVITRTRLVLVHDRDGGDAWTGPRSQQRNPGIVDVVGIGCVLRIYAQSTVAGARVQDHERLCYQFLRHVRAALRTAVAKRRTLHAVTSGKLLNQQELQMLGLETWGGVVYELKFTVDMGVLDERTWVDPDAPEVALGPGGVTIRSTTKVRSTNDGGAPPETACG